MFFKALGFGEANWALLANFSLCALLTTPSSTPRNNDYTQDLELINTKLLPVELTYSDTTSNLHTFQEHFLHLSRENKHWPHGKVHSKWVSNRAHPFFLIFKIYSVRLAYRKRSPPKELSQIKSTAFIHLAKLQKCPTCAEEREDSSQPAWPFELVFVMLHFIAIHTTLPLRTCWGMDFVLCLGTLCLSWSFMKLPIANCSQTL